MFYLYCIVIIALFGCSTTVNFDLIRQPGCVGTAVAVLCFIVDVFLFLYIFFWHFAAPYLRAVLYDCLEILKRDWKCVHLLLITIPHTFAKNG